MDISLGNSGLKNSLLDFEQERSNNQKTISLLKGELLHFKHLHSGHQDNATELHQKLKSVSIAREENFSTNVESKLKAFFLTVGVLENHYSTLNKALNKFTQVRNTMSLQMAENEKKAIELEEEILKRELKSKFQCLTKKLSEIAFLRKSDKEFGSNKITKLNSKNHELKKKLKEENEAILKNYTFNLNQNIQIYRLVEKHLDEQTSLNEKLTKESENCSLRIKSLDVNFQEKTSALNDLKKTLDDLSSSLKFSMDQINTELKTIAEASKKTEETIETLKKEMIVLTETENVCLKEQVDLEEKKSKEETSVLDMQQKKLVAEGLKIELLKIKEHLEHQINSFKEKKVIIEDEFTALKEENTSLLEKLQEETTLNSKKLSELDVVVKDETLKVSNLESNLIDANKIRIKLDEELQKNVSLVSVSTLVKKKRSELNSKEEAYVKNKELLDKKSKALGDEISAVKEKQFKEIQELSTLFDKTEVGLEVAENQHFILNCQNEGLSKLLMELQQQRREEQLKFKELINQNNAESCEKVKVLEKGTAEIAAKLQVAQENFLILYNTFNKKYREKGSQLRSIKVKFENLSVMFEKAQTSNTQLKELLAKSLEVDSKQAQRSRSSLLSPVDKKRVVFSTDLEKFSPINFSQLQSDVNVKSILKRRKATADEAAKKIKVEKNN